MKSSTLFKSIILSLIISSISMSFSFINKESDNEFKRIVHSEPLTVQATGHIYKDGEPYVCAKGKTTCGVAKRIISKDWIVIEVYPQVYRFDEEKWVTCTGTGGHPKDPVRCDYWCRFVNIYKKKNLENGDTEVSWEFISWKHDQPRKARLKN